MLICCTLPPFCSADTRKTPMTRRSWKEISCHEAGTVGKIRMIPVWLCISISCIPVCIYVCPTSAHRGFRYGYRRYKGNTFTLKTALFGWQSMILRSDLTLLNINISKNSTFAWFVSQKVCIINDYSYFCSMRTRQASQRCSNVRVVFVFMGIWQQEFRS